MSKQTLYSRLRGAGMNAYGACGMLANIDAESAFRSNNLQNTASKALGMTDEEYTKAVDTGVFTRADFISSKHQGYGLCQWTYHTRKAALYDFAKAQGKSIGDEGMQVDYLLKELKSSYKAVWTTLCNAKSVREATEVVMLKFERPKNQSQDAIDKRVAKGEAIYKELCGSGTVVADYTMDRLKQGATGTDVLVYQCLMTKLGYYDGDLDSKFGPACAKVCDAFQTKYPECGTNGKPDGSFGPKCWAKLLSLFK